MLKAIETTYKGYRFRSRLEARCAVFFDAMGIRWEYEPEGFETSEGWYLPDFRIAAEMWVEVKHPGDMDLRLPKAFSSQVSCGVLIFRGPSEHPCLHIQGDYRGLALITPPTEGKYHPVCFSWGCGMDEHDTYATLGMDGDGLARRAIDKARAARFEHGETPR